MYAISRIALVSYFLQGMKSLCDEPSLTRRQKPQLSQQEWEDMSYIIGGAMQFQTSVRITVFGDYEDEVWIGGPEVYANALCIMNEEERRRVPVEKVVGVGHV